MPTHKVPPHNEEAEQSALGAILIDTDAMNLISTLLKSDDFYSATNAMIYGGMLDLYEERKPIDVVTLTAQLKKKKQYDTVGGSYLTDLLNMVPTAANVEHYALLIKESSTK